MPRRVARFKPSTDTPSKSQYHDPAVGIVHTDTWSESQRQSALIEHLDNDEIHAAVSLTRSWWLDENEVPGALDDKLSHAAYEGLKSTVLDSMHTRARPVLLALSHTAPWYTSWLDTLCLFGLAGCQSKRFLDQLASFDSRVSRDEALEALRAARAERRAMMQPGRNRKLAGARPDWVPRDCGAALEQMEAANPDSGSTNSDYHQAGKSKRRTARGGTGEESSTISLDSENNELVSPDDGASTADDLLIQNDDGPAVGGQSGMQMGTSRQEQSLGVDKATFGDGNMHCSPTPRTPSFPWGVKQRRPMRFDSDSGSSSRRRSIEQARRWDVAPAPADCSLTSQRTSSAQDFDAIKNSLQTSLPRSQRFSALDCTTPPELYDDNDDEVDLHDTYIDNQSAVLPTSPSFGTLSLVSAASPLSTMNNFSKRGRDDQDGTNEHVYTRSSFKRIKASPTTGKDSPLSEPLTAVHLNHWITAIGASAPDIKIKLGNINQHEQVAHADPLVSRYIGIVEDESRFLIIYISRTAGRSRCRVYCDADHPQLDQAIAVGKTVSDDTLRRPLTPIIACTSVATDQTEASVEEPTEASAADLAAASTAVAQACAMVARLHTSAGGMPQEAMTALIGDLWASAIRQVHADALDPRQIAPSLRPTFAYNLSAIDEPIDMTLPVNTTQPEDSLSVRSRSKFMTFLDLYIDTCMQQNSEALRETEIVAMNAHAIYGLALAKAGGGHGEHSSPRAELDSTLGTLNSAIAALPATSSALAAIQQHRTIVLQKIEQLSNGHNCWQNIQQSMLQVQGRMSMLQRDLLQAPTRLKADFAQCMLNKIVELGFEVPEMDVGESRDSSLMDG